MNRNTIATQILRQFVVRFEQTETIVRLDEISQKVLSISISMKMILTSKYGEMVQRASIRFTFVLL